MRLLTVFIDDTALRKGAVSNSCQCIYNFNPDFSRGNLKPDLCSYIYALYDGILITDFKSVHYRHWIFFH